jgi:uncharacterized Zn finger protein
MCKHVAAVLYGVGARLDERPELLFALRQANEKDLIARAGTGMPASGKRPASGRILQASKLSEIFGIDLAPNPAPTSPSPPTRSPARARPSRPSRGRAPAPKKRTSR